MNPFHHRALKQTAADRLADNSRARQVLLIYVGISFGLSLLSLLISWFMNHQANQLGGLGNLGTRSLLSTIGTALPLIISLGLTCLDLGYLSSMLRVSRGQYTSPNALRLGFDRLWPLFRCLIARAGIYMFLGLGAAYAASLVFVISPLSGDAIGMLGSGVPDVAAMDPAQAAELLSAMAPMFLIYFVLLAVFFIPLTYSWRMANYVIIDRPGMGGFAVLRESSKMMRGHRMELFRLDVSLWWYYLLTFAATVLCYGDSLLPALGIALPFSPEVSYFGFYLLYLAVQFAIHWFFRNRVEVTYALAYEAICPKQEEGGVVLGSIFQM